jgi:hypothetical protein
MQQRQGGTLLPMRKGGCGGREAPERKMTLDVAAGWNKPASSRAEEAVERLRKPEDGSKWSVGGSAKKRSRARVMSRRGNETQRQVKPSIAR